MDFPSYDEQLFVNVYVKITVENFNEYDHREWTRCKVELRSLKIFFELHFRLRLRLKLTITARNLSSETASVLSGLGESSLIHGHDFYGVTDARDGEVFANGVEEKLDNTKLAFKMEPLDKNNIRTVSAI